MFQVGKILFAPMHSRRQRRFTHTNVAMRSFNRDELIDWLMRLVGWWEYQCVAAVFEVQKAPLKVRIEAFRKLNASPREIPGCDCVANPLLALQRVST